MIKVLSCNKVEHTLLLFSLLFSMFILQSVIVRSKSKQGVITPFYINFDAGLQCDSDPDNNLSGNAGISEDYYNKQVHQFLELKDSTE